MAFTSGIVVVENDNTVRKGAIQMESFAGADLHKRVTQLAVLVLGNKGDREVRSE
jgi:hypothetical protein